MIFQWYSAVANALFHRDYQLREQAEIRVSPESIVLLNYGGPDRSIRQEDFINRERERIFRKTLRLQSMLFLMPM